MTETANVSESGSFWKVLLYQLVFAPWAAPRRRAARPKLVKGLLLLGAFAWLWGTELLLQHAGTTTRAVITRAWEDWEAVVGPNERTGMRQVCLASFRFQAANGTTVTDTRECPTEFPEWEVTLDRMEYQLDPARPMHAEVRYLPWKPTRNHFTSEERWTIERVFVAAVGLVVLNGALGCLFSAVSALATSARPK